VTPAAVPAIALASALISAGATILIRRGLRHDGPYTAFWMNLAVGTVGLWAGLHGESFLQAGMHHLEARFDFELLREQLMGTGINTMSPFSDFPFLRQAFTEGERWPVNRDSCLPTNRPEISTRRWPRA